MWSFLIVFALLFIVSGLDDVFIDVCYWGRYVYRLFKWRGNKPLTYEELAAHPEQPIAILVPCWHEANVIATMLKHNTYSIDYTNYVIFVGVYPNDPQTVAEVQGVARITPRVHCVIGDTPGPTNKAANLNNIYKAVKEYEKNLPAPFQIMVFHDSEDVIHPLSFKLYNYLIPRKDMIQLPVFPLSVSHWNFTHWLYADEFSENHTKDIIVRESIKAHVPSAGVGTAFSRTVLMALEDPQNATPFSVDSLTEDYRTSLMVRLQHYKQIFVTQSILRTQWVRKGVFRSRYIQKRRKEMIATRALFPTEYMKAVRQKSRWIIGIVFQEWQHSQWSNEWRIRYSLGHDRKASITHFINGSGYVFFFFWFFYSWLTWFNPSYPSLQEQLNMHPWVWWLIVVVTFIMIERLIQRFIATRRIYGWTAAFLSVPRAFYGNILNLHALIRAYRIYFTAVKTKTKKGGGGVAWDKTEHQFPGRHILVPYRRRLGDLILEKKLLSPEQLNQVIVEQQRSGERLGDALRRLNLIKASDLIQLLAHQYQLDIFPESELASRVAGVSALLSKKMRRRLAFYDIKPLAVDVNRQEIKLGIIDPTNEPLLEQVLKKVKPFKASFVLIDDGA